jgi:tripartite-type tricarboxylate transporter receptor subunit TctC
MRSFTRRSFTFAALGSLAVATSLDLATAASAQDFPNRPITFVVPFGAGTGADIAARIVAERMAALLGQPIVVDNKVGASGMIGTDYVAHSASDGYTLLFASNSTHGTNSSLLKNINYDPVKDFAPIGRFGRYVYLLTANAQLGIKTVPDLVKYAKENPGKLSYAAGQSTSRIMAEVFKKATGTDITYVAYKSSPQALNDVVAGRVGMMFIDVTASRGFLKAGTLLPLAVTSAEPSTLLPDVPTIANEIKTSYELDAWTGLVAPAGTPANVLARLNSKLNQALGEEDTKRRLADLGIEPLPTSPDEFGTFIKSEVERLGKYIKETGIEPQ